ASAGKPSPGSSPTSVDSTAGQASQGVARQRRQNAPNTRDTPPVRVCTEPGGRTRCPQWVETPTGRRDRTTASRRVDQGVTSAFQWTSAAPILAASRGTTSAG